MKRLWIFVTLFILTLSGVCAELTKQDLEEIRSIIKEENDDLRVELKSDIASVRTELKAEITGVRGEVVGVRGEVASIRWMIGVLALIVIAGFALPQFLGRTTSSEIRQLYDRVSRLEAKIENLGR